MGSSPLWRPCTAILYTALPGRNHRFPEAGDKSRFFAGELLRGGTFLTSRQKRHVQSVTREACDVVQRWIDDGKCNPVDPRHLFIMLWSTTQFYADFAPMAATTLEVSRLRKADFANAADQIIAMLGLWRE